MHPLIKKLLSNRVTLILVLTIIILISLRFLILPFSPPGFFIDEAASGAHVIAMVMHHTNAYGQIWPFFSQSLDGGFTTPIYLYPLTLWAAIFGFSEFALRAFSQFVTVLAILSMAIGMQLWLGKRFGLITTIVGLAIPWGWLQGSIAWDPAIVPLFVSGTFLGWSLINARTSGKARLTGLILLPLNLSLLAYVYPPYWAVVPFLAIGAYTSLFIGKHIRIWQIILSFCSMALVAIPLVMFITSPTSLGRASAVSIFLNTSIFGAIGLFIHNIVLLIDPFFFFIYGDFNMRHSVGWQGMLGLAALVPILVVVIVIIKKLLHTQNIVSTRTELYLIAVGAAGFLISCIGSALTSEGQPQSLRASGAWPFALILIVIGWAFLLRHKAQWLKWSAIIIFIVATVAYSVDLRFFYPARSAKAFDEPVRVDIFNGQPVQYSRLAQEYYRNR